MTIANLTQEEQAEMNRTCPALSLDIQNKRGKFPVRGLGDLLDQILNAVNQGGGGATGEILTITKTWITDAKYRFTIRNTSHAAATTFNLYFTQDLNSDQGAGGSRTPTYVKGTYNGIGTMGGWSIVTASDGEAIVDVEATSGRPPETQDCYAKIYSSPLMPVPIQLAYLAVTFIISA